MSTEAEEEPVPEPARGRRSETILVVEDDEDVRTYSTRRLRELGYHVLEAANARAALQVLEGHPEVAVLFTDIGLPGGMNGRQLAEEARKRRPNLKVLFTTGYARNAIVHDGRLDPGVELLTKPFTQAALAEKLRDIIDAKSTPGARACSSKTKPSFRCSRRNIWRRRPQGRYGLLGGGRAEQAAAHPRWR